MRIHFLLLLFVCGTSLAAAPLAPDVIVENYQVASREAAGLLNGASMEVEIQAQVPKLKKRGRLHAFRHISSLGRISYDALRWEGDNSIKTGVIARYLGAETQAQNDRQPSLAVTPQNYKFRYRGLAKVEGRDVHVFAVTPRKKRTGLFKGELCIDAGTYLPVRESGIFVKNPSIFLKSVEFVRTYEILDGIAVPRQIQSVVETRLVGKAELMVEYTHYAMTQGAASAGLLEGSRQ